MRHGFVKTAAATPLIEVADCFHNTERILELVREMNSAGAKIMVFPELCITGYTCGDLFWHNTLLQDAKQRLIWLARETRSIDALIIVGLPIPAAGNLYNAAAILNRGKLLALIPKTLIPDHDGSAEGRCFSPALDGIGTIHIDGNDVPFGTDILFICDELRELVVGCEIAEDLWGPKPPGVKHALAGATVIANLSADDEIIEKDVYRRQLVAGQSGRLLCAYIYAGAGEGESTTDLVFAGHNIIAENSKILAESKRFENEITYADIDVKRLVTERRKNSLFHAVYQKDYRYLGFSLENSETTLTRKFDPLPFVPSDERIREKRCEEILTIQALGLKKRLSHAHCNGAVIGISGGLDSTLALLVTARAFDMLGKEREKITAVTMPCFGTTDRTYHNACDLTKKLGATLKEVDIKKAVTQHFKDIGQNPDDHDVTFENSQARERTQVLMDLANQMNALVVGTGDLSEMALGWTTYNGDHMSMYGVNASVPKTLIRYVVRYYADVCEDKQLASVLYDILDTPVSPELLPPKDGQISQKTEDLVGPYELHDFFLYYMQRAGYEPDKIYRIAKIAFEGEYKDKEILKWLTNFYKRFFSQQFKRSCSPDGPKVGTVALSPRGDLKMPSDASVRSWLEKVGKLTE